MINNVYKKINFNPNRIENHGSNNKKDPPNVETFSNVTKKRIELEKQVKNYKNKKRKLPLEDKNFFLNNKIDDDDEDKSSTQENIYVKFEIPNCKYRCVACKLIIRNKKLVMVCNDVLPYINKFGKIKIIQQTQNLDNPSPPPPPPIFDDIDFSTDDNSSNILVNNNDYIDDDDLDDDDDVNKHHHHHHNKIRNNNINDGNNKNEINNDDGLFRICCSCYLKIFKYNKENKNNVDVKNKTSNICDNFKCRKVIYHDGYCLEHFLLYKYQN